MRRRAAVLVAAAVCLVGRWTAAQGDVRPPQMPHLPGHADGLPPLPDKSPRNANYTIEARLDPEKHTITGTLVLDWRNTSDQPLDHFPFHLYWNAFRNNLSTSARGGGGRRRPNIGEGDDRTFGYTEVATIRRLGETEETLKPRYISPDDGNADDRTVMEVQSSRAVAPGQTARFRIEWTSLIPHGKVGRAGWVHDYNFIAQWFPKIGVFWKGKWNAHQFHPWTEFFADYGVYDVSLTVPRDYVIGATGRLESEKDNGDGTRTVRFVQEDVHDFAWTGSLRFREKKATFDDPGYPPVEIRLLVQPEHQHLADRYIEATKIALRAYGTWSAPYPYPGITVVDPAWRSGSGGMEYPTLFTGGANVFAPPALQSPESVTIHEAGHQFWYGLVGNNEFEEAWLDEGLNTYTQRKAMEVALGAKGWGRRYFGLTSGRGGRTGWPVVAPGVWIGRGREDLATLREHGRTDVMARPGWEYRTSGSYTINSYGKPGLTLQTLEGLLGDDVMTRVMRTYARRYRFAHPTTADFIAVVNEVTGKDHRWFFDETFFSSGLVDYAVGVDVSPVRALEGWAESEAGPLRLTPRPAVKGEPKGPWESKVTVRRLGEARLPVEVRVDFADGRSVRETWDGKDTWKRFTYSDASKVVRAVVDPEGKIALDVDRGNNAWIAETGFARRAATKWAARWMFWLQNLLELHLLLG
jgi:Peptidase family M1 domain